MPRIYCNTQQVIQSKDKSVLIEEFGNIYYLNESKWFAIEYSFVKYKCIHKNSLLIGNDIRVCLKTGEWSDASPHCTKKGNTKY